MKKHGAVCRSLSVLEGMLSGGYFYLARRDKDPLALLTACTCLACSVFHGMIGIQEDEDDIILLEEAEDD